MCQFSSLFYSYYSDSDEHDINHSQKCQKINEVGSLDNGHIMRDPDMELGFDSQCDENFEVVSDIV